MSAADTPGRTAGPRPVIAFQGSRTGRSAFALVNARWSAGLAETDEWDVVDHDATAGRRPDVLVHHDFASDFAEFHAPPGTCAVAVRTWDFGPLPRRWVEKINGEFRQLWVPTRWIAQQARAAGVEPERIRVVPHGVDPGVYRPEGGVYPLPSDKRFAFLFVGGVCVRKGSDTLLQAYAEAFSPADDVTLVIKDHSQDLFYRDAAIRERMRRLMSDPGAPEIVHIDRFLPDSELAALYRRCDAAVFPYRAEGFCLPILECMASGTPAIAPRFGACLDFCGDETSYLMPVRRIHLPVNRRFKVALGFPQDVEEVDFCEVEVSTLAGYLRRAYEAPASERVRKAATGTAVAHGRFTWRDSLACVRRCLAELRWRPPAARLTRRRASSGRPGRSRRRSAPS
ncbi:MAG: glycosyltransferase family 4 protein [Candidatus Rokuibacteriota bacterium]